MDGVETGAGGSVMAVSKKFKHDIVRDTLRKLLDLDTDEMDREMMKHLLDTGRCPTEFPELGIDDCPSLSELGGVREVRQCPACWMKALHNPDKDEVW